MRLISNVHNMSGHVVLNRQSRVEGEWLNIEYNTDANVANNLRKENMAKISTVLAEKIEQRVHEKQCNIVTSGCIAFTTTD